MKKYTIEYIKSSFESEGYTLLSTNYTGCTQKLEYICPKGHRHSITFDKWLGGRRCFYCNGNIKLSNDYVKHALEKEGYTLLSEYTNSNTKFMFKCNNGHTGEMKWDHWRDGHRCAECAGNKKNSFDDIKNMFEKEGYKLLNSTYENSHSSMEYICPNGHKGSILYYNWISGNRCLECSGKSKKTIEFIKNEVNKDGYILFTDKYLNCDQKLHLVCPNGHDYFVSWDNWNHSKSRCPKCNDWGTSAQEQSVIEFLKSYFSNVVEHDRTIISPYELDIVIPEKKIAIEYCGLYWHSELAGKDKNYHLNKLKACNDKGYTLITIFEDELVNHKDVVLSRLKNIFGIVDDVCVVYARKCEVREISTSDASNFCNKYHLQGYNGAKIKLGLFYNSLLVSVMTFSRPSISKGGNPNSDMWELQRFCSLTNYRIIGGASKLLKHFENNYKWATIISYADRRWSIGNLYNQLCFKYVGATQTNYWYLKKQERIHRFALRKNSEDPKDQTEWEIRRYQGWNRIWDCGNLKYVKHFNN